MAAVADVVADVLLEALELGDELDPQAANSAPAAAMTIKATVTNIAFLNLPMTLPFSMVLLHIRMAGVTPALLWILRPERASPFFLYGTM